MAEVPAFAIYDFVQDPSAFLKPKYDEQGRTISINAVSTYNVFPAHLRALPGGLPHEGYFYFCLDFSDPTRRTYEIKYHGLREGLNTVRAYNLGYNGGAQTSRTPAYIDIPKVVPEKTLLFTGTLSGCSVVVTNLDNDTYRIFHDSREDSSLLYDNVQMAIDYSGYSLSNAGIACAFMQYRGGKWLLFGQLQTLTAVNGRTVVVPRLTQANLGLQPGYFPVIVSPPGSYDPAEMQKIFDARRTMNRLQLRRVASEALPLENIPNVPDGDFTPFEGNGISLQNPGVRHSQAIREAINQSQGDISSQYVAARGEDALVNSVLQWQNVNLKQLVDPVKRESENLDYIYLWIKQKAARGLDAVVIIDQRAGPNIRSIATVLPNAKTFEEQAGNTAGERLISRELQLLLDSSNDFNKGYYDYRKVDIPGFNPNMSASKMTKLFDASPNLSRTQMGALIHYIAITNKEDFIQFIWGQTDTVVEMFLKAGGLPKPMPQNFVLGVVPDEHGGRCYPLVRAMTVALARTEFAVDQLIGKVAELAYPPDAKNADLFRKCLTDLCKSYPATAASTLISRESTLENAISELAPAEGVVTMYTLNTPIHAMLLSGTMKSGKPTYCFYDPNFALVAFSSPDALLEAITAFFLDLGFAKVYGAEGIESNPLFTLVNIDTDAMARIPFNFKLEVEDLQEPETLAESVDIDRVTTFNLPDPNAKDPTDCLIVDAEANLIQGLRLMSAWRDATERLESRNALGSDWVPAIQTAEDVKTGGYRVQFINLKQPNETRWITTTDAAIKDFKTYLEIRLSALTKAYTLQGGVFIAMTGATNAQTLDGRRAALVLKTMVDHLQNKNYARPGDRGINCRLAIALELQRHLHFTTSGQASSTDPRSTTEVTQTPASLKDSDAPQSLITAITTALGSVPGVGTVVGHERTGHRLDQGQSEIDAVLFNSQLAPSSAGPLPGVANVHSGGNGVVSQTGVRAVEVAEIPPTFKVPPVYGNPSKVTSVGSKVYVTTDAGYVLQLTASKTFVLKAVNQTWFDQLKSGAKQPWWNTLSSLMESQHVAIVAVIGMRDRDTHTVVATWLTQGKLVVPSSHLWSQSLHVAGLTCDGKDAWLFTWLGKEEGQLYSQGLVPDESLSRIFSPSAPKVSAASIPAATKKLANHPFKSLLMTDRGLRYGTTDGVFLTLPDSKTITLRGVDRHWRENHSENLKADLGELTKQWKHGEIVSLQAIEPNIPPAWYFVPAAKLFAVDLDDANWLSLPAWLGTDLDRTFGYFYLTFAGVIFAVDLTAGSFGRIVQYVTEVVQMGDTLVVVPRGPEFDLSTQWRNRFAAAPEKGVSWVYHQAVIVQPTGSDTTKLIRVDLKNHDQLLLRKMGENLLVVDVSTGRCLTIWRAYGTDPAYTNVALQFTGGDSTQDLANLIRPADVQRTQTWLQTYAKLSAPPDVTLKTIYYYLEHSKVASKTA